MKRMSPTTCSSVTSASGGSRTAFRSRTAASSSSSSSSTVAYSIGNASSGKANGEKHAVPAAGSSMNTVGRSSTAGMGSLASSSSSASKTSRKTPSAGSGSGSKAARANGKKSVYKHVPHALKPVHLVAKRNARERRRVQAVNSAFLRLRKHVPYEPRHKRLSKVKTLRVAITYISHLQDMIRDHDRRLSARHQQHHHHHLNILDEAASSTAVIVNNNNNNNNNSGNSDNFNVYDNSYQFMNNACVEEAVGDQPRSGIALHHHGLSSSSSSSPSSSSHFLHASPHGAVHGPVSAEHLSGSWSDGLHYTGPVDNNKMPNCAMDNTLYFAPPCPPQHYDVTGNGSYLPYDTYSVQSPYQLMR